MYCTKRQSACFTFPCPSACYVCALHFHWGNIHADKHAPCHWEGCVFHVFFPVREGKCIHRVQGVPFQPKMHLPVLQVQINMLPQWETKGPRADFVPCFLKKKVCPPPTTCSPLLYSKSHIVSVERQANKDFGFEDFCLTEQLIPCLSTSLSFSVD